MSNSKSKSFRILESLFLFLEKWSWLLVVSLFTFVTLCTILYQALDSDSNQVSISILVPLHFRLFYDLSLFKNSA